MSIDINTFALIKSYIKNHGGNQQVSWNNINDKPFGETVVEPVDFTWDGNLNGITVYDVSLPNDDKAKFIKISDTVPVDMKVQTISYVKCDVDGLMEVNRALTDFDIQDGYMFYHEDFATTSMRFGKGYIFIVLTKEGAVASGFPSVGVYIAYDGENNGMAQYYFTEIHISGFEEVVAVPNKYLPEHLQFGEVEAYEVVLEEMVIDGLYDASEYVGSPLWMGTTTIDTHCTMNPNDTYLVNIGDKAYICNTSSIITDGTYNYVCIGNYDVSFGLNGLEEDLSFSNPEAPFYIVYTSESEKVPMFANFDINGSMLSIHHVTKEVKTIDTEYLPEHLQFGETVSSEVVLEETVLNVEESNYEGIYATYDESLTLVKKLKANEVYIVRLDGKEYECVAGIQEGSGMSLILLGNHNYSVGVSDENTEYSNEEAPFWIMNLYTDQNPDVNMVQATTNFDANGSTLSIHHVTKEIKKIDVKYIPLDEILEVIENGTY